MKNLYQIREWRNLSPLLLLHMLWKAKAFNAEKIIEWWKALFTYLDVGYFHLLRGNTMASLRNNTKGRKLTETAWFVWWKLNVYERPSWPFKDSVPMEQFSVYSFTRNLFNVCWWWAAFKNTFDVFFSERKIYDSCLSELQLSSGLNKRLRTYLKRNSNRSHQKASEPLPLGRLNWNPFPHPLLFTIMKWRFSWEDLLAENWLEMVAMSSI